MMNPKEPDDFEPLQDLQWLARFYKQHSRDERAIALLKQVKNVKKKAQKVFGESGDVSNVIPMFPDMPIEYNPSNENGRQ